MNFLPNWLLECLHIQLILKNNCNELTGDQPRTIIYYPIIFDEDEELDICWKDWWTQDFVAITLNKKNKRLCVIFCFWELAAKYMNSILFVCKNICWMEPKINLGVFEEHKFQNVGLNNKDEDTPLNNLWNVCPFFVLGKNLNFLNLLFVKTDRCWCN